jgi:hypothetical protein
MKKLILAAVISAFSVSASAYACDGMKDHANKGDNPAPTAKKQDKKQDQSKSDKS